MDRQKFAEKYGVPILRKFEEALDASGGMLDGVEIGFDEEGYLLLQFIWNDEEIVVN